MRLLLTLSAILSIASSISQIDPCSADINGDLIVDISDFTQLNSSYGDECIDCPEDLNSDGVVNINDFLNLNSMMGKRCYSVRVYPSGPQDRRGSNSYPSIPVDPPHNPSSAHALGGITATSIVNGQLHNVSIFNSDSLMIEINEGSGVWVHDPITGDSLEGLTIKHIRGVTPDTVYGYWRLAGKWDACIGTLGVDYDYDAPYNSIMFKVKYTLWYHVAGYPSEMSGTLTKYTLHEGPIDSSCLDNFFHPYPFTTNLIFDSPTYSVME